MGSYYSTPESTETYCKLKRNYGWKKDHFDHRDSFHSFINTNKGINVDLTANANIDVYNQGKLGSCTSNAISYCYEYDEYVQNEATKFHPSRLFIYYNERDMEGTTNSDAGAEIRDGIKSINSIGVCSEDDWPYDINKFTEKPSENCYNFAESHKTVNYKRVLQTVDHINECLHSGFPIAFGFMVYDSFESEEVSKTGMVPMPNESEENLLGGHAVTIVGINHDDKTFKVRNSWGAEWGDNGYCYFPFEFIVNSKYCSDFWTVSKIRDYESFGPLNRPDGDMDVDMDIVDMDIDIEELPPLVPKRLPPIIVEKDYCFLPPKPLFNKKSSKSIYHKRRELFREKPFTNFDMSEFDLTEFNFDSFQKKYS